MLSHRFVRFFVVVGLLAGLLPASTGIALGATTAIKPSALGAWSTSASTAGGSVNFVVDATAPSGNGALQLTTDITNPAKASLLILPVCR